MLYSLVLPHVLPAMTTALIEHLPVSVNQSLRTGDKILDLSIDLGAAYAQNCPPVSYFRLVSRETVTLREILVAAGTPAFPAPRWLCSARSRMSRLMPRSPARCA